MAFTAISSSLPSCSFVRSFMSSLSLVSSFPHISISTASPFISPNPAHAKKWEVFFQHHVSARIFRTWRVYASQAPNNRQRPPPGVDTRIHWQTEEEGWIGGPTPSKSQSNRDQKKENNNNILGPNLADLLNNSFDSHYQFLGVSAEANLEEIKSAYRRLSKEYHPDTTSLPLKAASDKFMKLKQVYEVLSNEESRKFYDWTLAQEEASRQADKLRLKLQDPYEKELQNWKSTPDMVDRLGGRNMDLSDQATTALTLDIFIILFAICCIVYVLLFKEPYY